MLHKPLQIYGDPNFRDIEMGDIDALVDIAREFFEESELPSFATFAPENIRLALEVTIQSPAMVGIVFTLDDKVEAFLTFVMDTAYTKEPMAMGHLFFVRPAHRHSPLGRQMMEMAEDIASDYGCVVFYQGVMAGIESVAKTMPNMLVKSGYEPLWWGRKVLRERF